MSNLNKHVHRGPLDHLTEI